MTTTAPRLRFATWNVNSVLARLPRLIDWLEQTSPDVVCLQETKCADDQFPAQPIRELGYEVATHGDGRWNGVALLSRIGLDDVTRGLTGDTGFEGIEARALGATCAGSRIWSLYCPNGREPDHPHFAYKLRWLAALRDVVADELRDDRPLTLLGDFNIAPTDADVYDPTAYIGSTHVTPEERQALADVLALGLDDVVPRPIKGDRPFTYWDYRAGMFHKNMGMRIDLVLATPALSGAVRDAYIDREARKGKGPSDHAPVVVDIGTAASAP